MSGQQYFLMSILAILSAAYLRIMNTIFPKSSAHVIDTSTASKEEEKLYISNSSQGVCMPLKKGSSKKTLRCHDDC
jgi:hypothetical protein